MKSLAPALAASAALLIALNAAADTLGDAEKGGVLFKQSCALCHAAALGPGGQVISGQGPSLVGVVGRSAGSLSNFNYSKALQASGLIWSADTLDQFLKSPSSMVPGTTMPIPVPDANSRREIIAFLSTLTQQGAAVIPTAASPESGDPNDWQHDFPGRSHVVLLANLPPPYATSSAGNGPKGRRAACGCVPVGAQGLHGEAVHRRPGGPEARAHRAEWRHLHCGNPCRARARAPRGRGRGCAVQQRRVRREPLGTVRHSLLSEHG